MMEEAVPQDPLIGVTLGGLYRIERLIGKGGMGRVYEATHTHLGKAYAVKVLSARRADKPGAAERLLREAKSATRIDHEHIVKVLNFDEHDTHGFFFVMELLEGEDLSKRIARGPMAIDAALEIAVQAGAALQAAHDAGIVHRDLKPENIFLTQKNGRDFVKVLDFGISKIKEPEQTDVKLTATDQILGTPLYISPELARGAATIDHRADIYALGVIAYEMITGTPPFSGSNQFQLLYQHGNEAPDPPSQRSQRAKVPPHVEAAILKALEKDPTRRFESMADFCDALQGRATTRSGRWKGLAVLAAALGTVALIAWLVPIPGSAPVATPALPAEVEAAPTAPSPADPVDDSPAPAAAVNLRLASNPSGASVTVDGEKRGKTPITLEFPRGTVAKVRFSLEGHQPKEQRVVADEDRTVRVRLRKRPPRPVPPIKEDF